MKVHLHRLGKTNELERFVTRMELGEPFHYDAPFIFIAKQHGNIIFINAFMLEKEKDVVMPRFVHMLLDPVIRRSKLGVNLLIQSENYLKLLGYTETFAYILKTNRKMSVLARKFGYKAEREDDKAVYYFKQLIREPILTIA